jgi:hypothetical protein
MRQDLMGQPVAEQPAERLIGRAEGDAGQEALFRG